VSDYGKLDIEAFADDYDDSAAKKKTPAVTDLGALYDYLFNYKDTEYTNLFRNFFRNQQAFAKGK